MPFKLFADEGPAEEDFERTKNVNSVSIICETLTILFQNSQYITAYMFGEKIKVGQMLSSTYVVSLLVSISMDIRFFKLKWLFFLLNI